MSNRNSPSHPAGAQLIELLHRRMFLKGGTIVGLASGPALLGACASLSPASSLIPGTGPTVSHRRMIGDIDVTTMLDGHFSLQQEQLENIDEAELERTLREAFLPPDQPIAIGISTHLLRTGGRTVLVGAGAGGQMGGSAGNLMTTLSSLGVHAEDIDDLVLTHMHPDHVGGAVTGDRAAFPNATLHLSDTEAAYWSDADNASNAPKPLTSFFPTAATVLAAYRERINRFTGEVDLGDGLSSHPMPGHTPGHTGFRVSSGDQQLLICGDMAIIAALQFARPATGVLFDSDVAAAAETRRRTLDMLASDRILATGTHLPFPAYGHVMVDGEAFRWQAEEWHFG